MIAGVIQKKTMGELEAALQTVDTALYDLLELRLDACSDLDIKRLSAIAMPLPVLFTLRRKEEGGGYAKTEEERLHDISELIRLKPAYLDVEAAVDSKVIAELQHLSPDTKLILSYHDFAQTPASLEAVLDGMKQRASGVIYKIAVTAQSTLDALRMLVFCKKYGNEVLGISMGEYGTSTRILAPVLHCGICYCPVDESSAPGQLPVVTLVNVYNTKVLDHNTKIYGLLGDPVGQSLGDVFHNGLNKETHTNAVYVKWQVPKADLPTALPLLYELGVQGLSVTMPLKETIIPLLASHDEAVAAIGATNTLVRTDKGFMGMNTDGYGAMRALNRRLEGKRVAMLGAGGAACALLYEIGKETRDVVVFNRTTDKQLPFAAPIVPFSDLPALAHAPYDIIINTLPFDLDFDYGKVPFLTGKVAMDISYGKPSTFLQLAGQNGCEVVDGAQMFVFQGVRQREIWGQS